MTIPEQVMIVIVVRKYGDELASVQLFTGVNPMMPEKVLSWFRK